MAKVALGSELQDIRGKVGTSVYSKSRSGPTLRVKVHGTTTHTPAQTTVRANFTKAAVALRNLSTAQVANWAAYGKTISKHNPVNGKKYNPTAGNAFTGLASKFLQINPTGTIPTTPPAGAFAGDNITVTAAGGTQQINFTASAANTTNTKTELLIQRLASANRTPTIKGYRSKGFVAYAAGGLTASVIVTTTGTYSVAYRFVNNLTGQETILNVLGNVVVS